MNDLFTAQIPDNDIHYLISKDTKGKIRVSIISYELKTDDKGNRWFIIHRQSGQLHGKLTDQPDKLVERGKATRNLWQQVELETNHLVKEKKDKGYKEISKNPEEYTDEELSNILGEVITSQDGIPKPMLAKQADKVTNTKIFNKEWYASRKIDGLRALIYMGTDGELHTASRGAMNYDAAMYEILSNKTLREVIGDTKLILDGECYKHGWSLQRLNSIARTQKTAVDYSILQFYWYDIVDPNSTFDERFSLMKDIRDDLNLGFDPYKEFRDDELRFQFVPQVEVSGWDNMLKLHNDYVEEGWEGLVIRDPDKVYRPNGRTNDMIKIKIYKDDMFRIVDYELGLRGTEDMVFIMGLPDGRTFKAKPLGDRVQKEEYVNNFDSMCRGHMGECKFFYYSDDGIPLQPAMKAIRDDLE